MKWQRTPAPAGPGPTEGGIDPDDLAPSAWGRIREVAWHLPRMLSGLGPIGPRGPEDGPPVLVIPGFFGTDRTTMELRRALARAGWRAHPWLLGINMGAKKDTLNLLCKRLKALEDPRKVLVAGPLIQLAMATLIMVSPAFGPYAFGAAFLAAVMIFTHTFAFGLLARLDGSGRALTGTPAMLMVGSAIGPFLGGTLVNGFGYEALAIAAACLAAVAVFCFSRLPPRAA
jgi:hypothetical protein